MAFQSRIILIYPSGRPNDIADAVARARGTAVHEIAFAIGYNGSMTIPLHSDGFTLVECYGPNLRNPGFIAATNRLYRLALAAFAVQQDDVIGFWSDDFYPERGWDSAIIECAGRHPSCLMQPFDGIRDSAALATIPFAQRDWWDTCNGGAIWPECYRRYFCDTDITVRAAKLGELRYVREARIIHRHPVAGTRAADFLDALGMQNYAADEATFKTRWAALNEGRP